jgi:hypothetical protein
MVVARPDPESVIAWWDPPFLVALPGSEGRFQPGLTFGLFRLLALRVCLCHRFPSRV